MNNILFHLHSTGYQLVKTETFLEPLTGSQKVLTRISEGNKDTIQIEIFCKTSSALFKAVYLYYIVFVLLN